MWNDESASTARTAPADHSISLLEQLGHVLLDCMRLPRQATDAQAHLLRAMQLCIDDQGWQAQSQHAEAMCPWQERLALDMLTHDEHSKSIAAIAAACSLSMPQFSRAFKARHGVTPQRWRLMHRVEQAKRLMLGTAMSLTDIACECGFAEQSHFTHAFVKLVGIPPRSWRSGLRPPEAMAIGEATA